MEIKQEKSDFATVAATRIWTERNGRLPLCESEEVSVNHLADIIRQAFDEQTPEDNLLRGFNYAEYKKQVRELVAAAQAFLDTSGRNHAPMPECSPENPTCDAYKLTIALAPFKDAP